MGNKVFITERDLLDEFAKSVAAVMVKSVELGEVITKEFLDAHPLKPSTEFKEKLFTEITVNHVKDGPVKVGSAENYLNNLIMNYKG